MRVEVGAGGLDIPPQEQKRGNRNHYSEVDLQFYLLVQLIESQDSIKTENWVLPYR